MLSCMLRLGMANLLTCDSGLSTHRVRYRALDSTNMPAARKFAQSSQGRSRHGET